jgi:DNA topoisomerase II
VHFQPWVTRPCPWPGDEIEPYYFLPVIPLVLVNGCEGVGTGWSTSIPQYNPTDIIRNVRKALHGEALEEMRPWYRHFKGLIIAHMSIYGNNH